MSLLRLRGIDNETKTFADELHYQQFITFLHSDIAVPVLDEEEKFCDAPNTKLIVMRREVSLGERAQVQKLET